METQTTPCESRLRRVLIVNAVFSGVSGLSGLLWTETVQKMLGLSSALPLYLVAPGLIVFAIWILVQVTRPNIHLGHALFFSTGDAMWVLGTIVVLLVGPHWFSPVGREIVIAIGLIVAVFCVLQSSAIVRLKRGACAVPK